MVEIIEVKTKKQIKEFVEFPLKLYKDCEYFVPPLYDDENVAEDNYYESKEEQNEPYSNQENCNDAPPQGGNKAKEIQPQTNATKNVHDQSVLDKTSSNTHEYYLSIQRELDELFKKYPRD